MEASVPIPPQVWDAFFAFLRPLIFGLGVLLLCALIVALLVAWKSGHLPFAGTAGRRLDDKLVNRMLDIQEGHSNAMNNLADAIRAGTAENLKQMQAQAASFMQGLRDIHDRFDAHIGGQQTHHQRGRVSL